MSTDRKLTLSIRRIKLKVIRHKIKEEDLKSVSLIGIISGKREMEGMLSVHVPEEFMWMAADGKKYTVKSHTRDSWSPISWEKKPINLQEY